MGVSSTECAIRGTASSSAQAKYQTTCQCTAAQQQQHHQQANIVLSAPQHAHHHHHHHHHHVASATGHPHSSHHHHHHHHQQQQQQQHHHHQVAVPHMANETNNKIFAPIKSKMKVLKKIKKKIGLAPRSSNSCTNNLPPLTFHQVHGDNIRLCNGNTIAKRHESFCKGVTFSARPVRIGEKVCVKFLEISDNWSGVIRFGFTSNDPINLRNGLPRYACPDLTNKPGYWAKALAERFAERDTVLFYYVTSAGDVHFGVNGEEKGVFFSGVETRSPLWAIIDVYGNSTAIEFVDPNRQHFNNLRRSPESHSNEDNAQHSRHSLSMDDVASNQGNRELDRIIVPAMQQLGIQSPPQPPQQQLQLEPVDLELPGLRFQPQGVLFAPLPFHPTRGRNIRFSNQQCVASRNDTEFCHGYAFTGRPLLLGERLVVQILSTEPMYVGALALGLTSCDPATLSADDLPEDSDQLLDRPEYWVVSKDVASSPQPGDEIAFTVTHSGQVQMSKNGGPTSVVMHVDQSLQLWAFVDVYGSTQRVRMLHSRAAPASPPRQRQLQPQPLVNPVSTVQPVIAASPLAGQPSAASATPGEHSRFEMQVKPVLGGGTVLVVSLPPQNAYAMGPEHIYGHRKPNGSVNRPASQSVAQDGASSTYVEPLASYEASSSSSTSSSAHLQQWREGLQPIAAGQPSECSICYERSIDSVLYMCGHMCMCYTCAIQQWRGKGGGQCPLCRAPIRDVIRIYRS